MYLTILLGEKYNGQFWVENFIQIYISYFQSDKKKRELKLKVIQSHHSFKHNFLSKKKKIMAHTQPTFPSELNKKSYLYGLSKKLQRFILSLINIWCWHNMNDSPTNLEQGATPSFTPEVKLWIIRYNQFFFIQILEFAKKNKSLMYVDVSKWFASKIIEFFS